MDTLMNHFEQLLENDIIREIDFEFCRFLEERHPEIDGDVLLAALLVSHLYRQGDVCLNLNAYSSQLLFEDAEIEVDIQTPALSEWISKLEKSPVVGKPGEFRPLILDESGRLYQQRLWKYEDALARELIKKADQQSIEIDEAILENGLSRLFDISGEETDWQAVAAASAVKNKLSIISGGPGTGKTSTVVRILALLLEQASAKNNSLDIALAAPTGKAAARLQESIQSARERLNVVDGIREAIPEKAKTLHQLLGARRNTSRFRHDEENPVPYDVVIVDEASMVDQALMSKLVTALLDDARLIMLGDKDQLASVEAGSVMGDICEIDSNFISRERAKWLSKISVFIPESYIVEDKKPLTDSITLLTKSYRFKAESGIGKLAECINRSDAEKALTLLSSSQFPDIVLAEVDHHKLISQLESGVVPFFKGVLECQSPEEAMKKLSAFRILAAHRRGPWGVEYLNRLVKKILNQHDLVPKYGDWYAGKPVMITVNDYALGLHNGDIGLCYPDEDGKHLVYFQKEEGIKSVAPGRLPEHEIAFAMTVHKSQGSEFDALSLVLPDKPSKVMSRELIYTAITRARNSLAIMGNAEVLRYSIQNKIERTSGLRDHLWN